MKYKADPQILDDKPKADLTNGVRLPRNYKSLVELEIRFHIFNFPPNGSFPCLKKLEVATRNPADSKFFNRIFSSCPVLEDLYMYGHFECTDAEEDGRVFRISIPTLKRLEVDLFVEELEYASDHTFIIKTPNLEHLTISDSSVASFEIDEMPSLLEAKLSIGIAKNFYKDQGHLEVEELRDRLVLILRGIRHAQSLFIYPETYAALSLVYNNDLLPTFPSLMRLTLGIDYVNAWKLLPCFLRNSRILQYLKLERESEELLNEAMDEEDVDVEDYFGWEAPEFEPFVSPHLKEIEMENLWKSEDEKEVVNYLMTNAQNLEKMVYY